MLVTLFDNTPQEHLGLVPMIVADAYHNSSNLDEFMPNVEACYGFPMPEMKGGIVIDGVYTYDGDPDLKPLAKFDLPKLDMVVYQYHYGIVAFVSSDYTFVVRMD